MRTNNRKANIYLMGFMGTGKSSVGRLLAQKLGRKFLDTDLWIEQKAGKPITDIFQEEGEKGFRQREHRCIEEVTKQTNLVVALGGGAVLRADNWHKIKASGITINLECPAELVFQRLRGEQTRPLLNVGDDEQKLSRIKSLLLQRQRHYRRADLTINVSEETSVPEIVEEILVKLRFISNFVG